MFLMTHSVVLDLDRYIFGQIYSLKLSIIFIIQCIERLLCKVVTRVRCFRFTVGNELSLLANSLHRI